MAKVRGRVHAPASRLPSGWQFFEGDALELLPPRSLHEPLGANDHGREVADTEQVDSRGERRGIQNGRFRACESMPATRPARRWYLGGNAVGMQAATRFYLELQERGWSLLAERQLRPAAHQSFHSFRLKARQHVGVDQQQ